MSLAPFSGSKPALFDPTLTMAGQLESSIQEISWVCRIRAKPPCFKVYVRRRVPVQPTQSGNSGLSTPLEIFKEGITKQTNGLLPPPPQPAKRKKMMSSNFQLRRSRRVAKIPPELGSFSAAKVCRHLGFCDEQEIISFTDARKYAKLFDSPLSMEHITALAALFEREVPPPGQI
jgi:hypothetical protein